MKIQNESGELETQIIVAMITNKAVIDAVCQIWKPPMFGVRWLDMIGGWAVEHYQQHGEVLGSEISVYLEEWVDTSRNTEDYDLVERLLETLSDRQEEKINEEFYIKRAEFLFNRNNLERLFDQPITDDLIDTIGNWNPIQLHDEEEVFAATEDMDFDFEDDGDETLYKYNGALGEFLNPMLQRDQFISFLAPEKRGKTWWLMDAAHRALRQSCKVAFFSAGDLSKGQLRKRFIVRVAQHPTRSCSLEFPVGLNFDEGEVDVEHDTRVFHSPVSPGIYKQKFRRQFRKLCRGPKDISKYLRYYVYHNTLTMARLNSVLDRRFAREGWAPDVIIIDYADLIVPPAGTKDVRDGTNQVWKSLRKLAMDRNCLVLTATQANAQAYGANRLGMHNFSEDKRKLAHVTGMIGINQTAEEKRMGLARLNWIVRREGEYDVADCVYTAGCLGIGNPAMKSAFYKMPDPVDDE